MYENILKRNRLLFTKDENNQISTYFVNFDYVELEKAIKKLDKYYGMGEIYETKENIHDFYEKGLKNWKISNLRTGIISKEIIDEEREIYEIKYHLYEPKELSKLLIEALSADYFFSKVFNELINYKPQNELEKELIIILFSTFKIKKIDDALSEEEKQSLPKTIDEDYFKPRILTFEDMVNDLAKKHEELFNALYIPSYADEFHFDEEKRERFIKDIISKLPTDKQLKQMNFGEYEIENTCIKKR